MLRQLVSAYTLTVLIYFGIICLVNLMSVLMSRIIDHYFEVEGGVLNLTVVISKMVVLRGFVPIVNILAIGSLLEYFIKLQYTVFKKIIKTIKNR